MIRALFTLMMAVGLATAAQEAHECQAREGEDGEEAALLQGRKVVTKPAATESCPTDCVGLYGCVFMEGRTCKDYYDERNKASEQACAEASPEGGKTYWCGEAPPTPATPPPTQGPTVDDEPLYVWSPGAKMCYIGVCGCNTQTSGTYAWCVEDCHQWVFDDSRGSRQFCPNGKKNTKMTNFCHLNQTNCEQSCNGHYCE